MLVVGEKSDKDVCTGKKKECPQRGASSLGAVGAPTKRHPDDDKTTQVGRSCSGSWLIYHCGGSSFSDHDSSSVTDALGHAKSCRFDYVKRTKRKKVKGKTRRYLACVYVAPKLTSPTITLPAPFKNARVKVTNYGSGVPVVSHNASEKIFGLGMTSSGLASFPLGTYGATATVESDGTSWYITAGAQDSGFVTPGSFTNSWTNAGNVAYRLQGNTMRLQGVLGGPGTANLAAFTLPNGFRPLNNLSLSMSAAGSAFNVVVGTDGTVKPTTSTVLALDGLAFTVD